MDLRAHGVGAFILCFALLSTQRAALSGQSLAEIPRTAFCPKVAAGPALDGALDDACWQKARAVSHFFMYQTQTLAREKTEAQCVWDDRAIYFGVRAHSSNLDAIRAAARKRDSGVWQDDSVELFLQPPSGDVNYHFIVNSLGTLYDAKSGTKAAKWNPAIETACAKKRGQGRSGHWTVEMAVPWKELGHAPKEGERWRVNFTRTDSNRGELSTWMIIETGGFEQPERFGNLLFRSPTADEVAKEQQYLAKLTAGDDSDGAEALVSVPLPSGVPTVVKKLPVQDCRVLRAFVGEPVDGCLRSKCYTGGVREYPSRGTGAGVNYRYNSNDGLHITLSDPDGFDAVVLRGGARAEMYADATHVARPGDGRLLWRFVGSGETEVAHFTERVKATTLSFFKTRRGNIADVAFYRIERARGERARETWAPASRPVTLAKPERKFAPENLHLGMVERYAEGHRDALLLAPAATDAKPIGLQGGKPIHLMTEPSADERGLAGIGLEANVQGAAKPLCLEVTVLDPLNPRRDVTSVNFSLDKDGKLSLFLDIPDQVLVKGSRIWLTLRADVDAKLVGPKGGAPLVRLELIPKDKALPEALAWRKLVMRTLFGPLSEPRPWGHFKKQSREEFYAVSDYAAQCPELFMTIDQCVALDPSDSLARQYREWVYLRHLKELSKVEPPPEPPEGVPSWAWYPRLAWLEIRQMADWWMAERLVPTGEVGVGVNDDTDFYQQFADLPYFERGGVAGKVMDACARLAELADKENLREGLNARATDALHAYEEGINHMALMARWHYGDPIYLERCMVSARSMEALTIVTEDGRRHFRDHSRMGFEDTQKPREPALDSHATPLMWHTALQVADYNRNPRALKTLREWADSWLRFQKPGQWATGIEVLSGKVTSFGKDRPFGGGYRSQAVVFTWLYALTGDARYIEPFLYYCRRGDAPYPLNGFVGDLVSLGALDGIEEKVLHRLARIGGVAALYIKKDPAPLIQQTIGGQRGWNASVDNLHDARRFPDMYTTAHQYTDRVFLGTLQVRASESYLGGYCKRNKFNPTLAVGWEGFGTDYGALVLRNQRDGLKVAVYSYAPETMNGRVQVWALEHGKYKLSVGLDKDGDFKTDSVVNSAELELARADHIALALDPKAVTIIELTQLEKLDPIVARPDLAIAAREVEVQDGKITGTVHNIGSAAAGEVVVAVLDGQGTLVLRESLGKLAAPVDLLPKRKPFSLQLPRAPAKGWRLALDPDNTIKEIYEGNNEVMLDSLPAIDYSKGWE